MVIHQSCKSRTLPNCLSNIRKDFLKSSFYFQTNKYGSWSDWLYSAPFERYRPLDHSKNNSSRSSDRSSELKVQKERAAKQRKTILLAIVIVLMTLGVIGVATYASIKSKGMYYFFTKGMYYFFTI